MKQLDKKPLENRVLDWCLRKETEVFETLLERRYVSTLLDIAHDFIEHEEYAFANAFLEIAQQYDGGKYKQEIDKFELQIKAGEVYEIYCIEMTGYAAK